MRKIITVTLICIAQLLLIVGTALGSGTALMLGTGQELRLDIPLEANKTYQISMDFRTDLQDAIVTMTLCAIGNNNEEVAFQIASENLGDGGSWHQIALAEVTTPQNPQRWELVLTANKEGRYYWQGLAVARTYSSEQSAQKYWSEKLATQGTFFTGLVVDARHLDVRRGISPRIYSEGGQLIYGGVLASQDLVQDRGVVGYGKELTPELLTRLELDPDYPYVAPLIVEAIAVADVARTGVYISEADTKRVLEAMVKYDFFARYAVIFLVE